jgi:peptide chain release factor 2
MSLISEDDKEIEKELKEKIEQLEEEIKEREIYFYLREKYDRKNAFLSIKAGTGGLDAEDWVSILARMYSRFFQRKGFKFKVLDESFTEAQVEDRVGRRSITFEVKGAYAYGILKGESGVHRLVRISPFSAKKLRHTSFALVEVIPDLGKIREIQIKPEDLKIETFRASGPGGQYVNRRETAVRITHLPTGITVSCQSERLQGANRERALAVLRARLVQLEEEKTRKEIEKIKGKKVATWGHQIRSYVFHPYQLVKDHRTKIESRDLENVLNGELDKFIEAEIKIISNSQ